MARIIEELLAAPERSQSWLGSEVATVEGRGTPYSQAAVSGWLDRIAEQPPFRVFAIERVLGMKPGSLSRQMGYLPVESKAVRSVAEAVEADPRLDARARRILLATYAELVKG